MKKILIITEYNPVGGSITFTRGLIHELEKNKNIQLTIIYFYDHRNKPDFPKNSKNKYLTIPLNTYNGTRIKILPKRIYLLHCCLSKLNNLKYDLVFTDLVYPTFSFQIARLCHQNFRHLPIYYHIHGSFFEETKSQEFNGKTSNFQQTIKYKILYFLEHFALKHCQKIFTNSVYSKKFTQKIHGNLALEINRPGIDFSFPLSAKKLNIFSAKRKNCLNPNHKHILFVSRIEPLKGITSFFENITPYLKQFPSVKFIVCSHFIESSFLYDFLEKLDQSKLGSQVLLVNSPSRSQLALLYRAADVTVMPSINLETFGFSTLESYYYHTPVVAFDIGANSELIPSSHLVKYPSKDSWPKLYQKINYVLRHPDTIDYSQYNYSWKGYVKKMLEK